MRRPSRFSGRMFSGCSRGTRLGRSGRGTWFSRQHWERGASLVRKAEMGMAKLGVSGNPSRVWKEVFHNHSLRREDEVMKARWGG